MWSFIIKVIFFNVVYFSATLISCSVINNSDNDVKLINISDRNLSVEVIFKNEKVEDYLKEIDEKMEFIQKLPEDYLKPFNETFFKMFLVLTKMSGESIVIGKRENPEPVCPNMTLKETPFEINEVGLTEMDELRIELTISQILNDNIEKAANVFQKICQNIRYLKRIIYQVYSVNPANVKLMLKFMEKLPEVYQKYLILWNLFEEMAINLELDSSQTSELHLKVNDFTTSEQSKKLTSREGKNVKMMKNILQTLTERKHCNLTNLDELRKLYAYYSHIYNNVEKILRQKMKESKENIIPYLVSFDNIGLKGFGIKILCNLLENEENFNLFDKIKLIKEIDKIKISEEYASASNVDKMFVDEIKIDLKNTSFILDKLIKEKIGASKHKNASADEILPFIRSFENEELKEEGLKIILEIFHENNKMQHPDLLKIALEIKTLEKDSPELKKLIPETFRNIVWEPVCLRMTYYSNEYLFSENDTNFFESPTSDRAVFSWRKTERPKFAEWKFAPVDDSGNHFLIKNLVHDEYLYAANGTYSGYSSFRKIFTAKHKIENKFAFHWTIIPMENSKFLFRNVLHDENLFVGSPDKTDRRSAFTYTTKKSTGSGNCYWSIEKCSGII